MAAKQFLLFGPQWAGGLQLSAKGVRIAVEMQHVHPHCPSAIHILRGVVDE